MTRIVKLPVGIHAWVRDGAEEVPGLLSGWRHGNDGWWVRVATVTNGQHQKTDPRGLDEEGLADLSLQSAEWWSSSKRAPAFGATDTDLPADAPKAIFFSAICLDSPFLNRRGYHAGAFMLADIHSED